MTQQHIHQPFYSHQNLQPPYATQNQPPHQNQPSYGHTIGTQNFENRGSNPQYGNQPGNQFYPIGQNQAAPMYPTLPSGKYISCFKYRLGTSQGQIRKHWRHMNMNLESAHSKGHYLKSLRSSQMEVLNPLNILGLKTSIRCILHSKLS